jgi:lipopolysaccharide transport system ATP-binding protein
MGLQKAILEVCGGSVSEPVVAFDSVYKSYPLYHKLTGGIKRFIFEFPEALRSMRKTRFSALEEVSFAVRQGESLGIIGRNGAGKSTILGLIAEVIRPSAGKVMVRGRVSPLLELGGGFHFELTGRENIELNGVLLGMTRSEVLKKMDEIVEFSELGEFTDQPIRSYSSGMLARLGFSVIAHLEPEILLIDEILAVGDLDFQKKCLEKMTAFRRSGVTMVFVSHSMSDVEFICDRVIWIDEHRVRASGPAAEVIAEYQEALK